MFVPSYEALIAFALVLVRTSALVLFSPLLGFGSGFSGYKIALVLGVSATVFPVVDWPTESIDLIGFGILAVRELLIGFFLGFLLHLTILAVRVTGEMIGHEMGFMIGRQVDPATGIQTPLITSFYENLLIAALLTMNGHQWLLRSLGDSFERAPIGDFSYGHGFTTTVLDAFAQMFRAGIAFAAPVMVFLMMVSILMGLMARAVPQVNVLEVGFTARIFVATGAMLLFAPMLEPAMTGLHSEFVGLLDRGLDALEG